MYSSNQGTGSARERLNSIHGSIVSGHSSPSDRAGATGAEDHPRASRSQPIGGRAGGEGTYRGRARGHGTSRFDEGPTGPTGPTRPAASVASATDRPWSVENSRSSRSAVASESRCTNRNAMSAARVDSEACWSETIRSRSCPLDSRKVAVGPDKTSSAPTASDSDVPLEDRSAVADGRSDRRSSQPEPGRGRSHDVPDPRRRLAELDPLDRLPGHLGREPLLLAPGQPRARGRPGASPARRGGSSGSAGTPGSPESPRTSARNSFLNATPSRTTPQRNAEKQ